MGNSRFLFSLFLTIGHVKAINNRPVIGIFDQPSTLGTPGETYIAASYVKWLEHAGARAVRLPWNSTDIYISGIVPQLSGVLFPGGAASVPQAARTVMKLATSMNDAGTPFPVWGTCLGFEWLNIIISQDDKFLSEFNGTENVSLALKFDEGAAMGSRMWSDKTVRDNAGKLPLAMNNHKEGVKPADFKSNQFLTEMFNVLTTNVDLAGSEFVSSMEAKNYPYFGVQWHPEKNNFEFGTLNGTDIPFETINHSSDGVRLSQEMARVFVDSARLVDGVGYNKLQFPLIFEERGVEVISGEEFEQIYLFPNPNNRQ
ncbi:hypothetical protein ScalyP_jg8292 [Parmales sp. scaly parma]|nr:hypothetical protein ScalyP_jg8292 [Parmales sp. scaly parma]